jgi:hypothetical protein
MIEAYRIYCNKYTPENKKEEHLTKALQLLEEYRQFFLSKGLAGRVAWYEKINHLTPEPPKNTTNSTLYNLLKI